MGFFDEYVLPALAYVGSTLDKPGRAARGVLAGRPEELANLIPFSDAMGMTDPERSIDGRELLEAWGAVGENEEGLDGGDVAGFLTEFLTDPTNILGGTGIAKRLFKHGKDVKKFDAATDAAKAANLDVDRALNRWDEVEAAMPKPREPFTPDRTININEPPEEAIERLRHSWPDISAEEVSRILHGTPQDVAEAVVPRHRGMPLQQYLDHDEHTRMVDRWMTIDRNLNLGRDVSPRDRRFYEGIDRDLINDTLPPPESVVSQILPPHPAAKAIADRAGTVAVGYSPVVEPAGVYRGFVMPDRPEISFIADAPLPTTLHATARELTHQIEGLHPDQYQAIVDALGPRAIGQSNVKRHGPGGEADDIIERLVNPRQSQQEGVAEILGRTAGKDATGQRYPMIDTLYSDRYSPQNYLTEAIRRDVPAANNPEAVAKIMLDMVEGKLARRNALVPAGPLEKVSDPLSRFAPSPQLSPEEVEALAMGYTPLPEAPPPPQLGAILKALAVHNTARPMAHGYNN